MMLKRLPLLYLTYYITFLYFLIALVHISDNFVDEFYVFS